MIQKAIRILFLLFPFISSSVIANQSDYSFKHLTLENGLSNSNVNCIVQDNQGFIWVGTENGLNRYDGYNFVHYFSDVNKKNSLFSNEIFDLMVDSDGDLWVGTFQGVFMYNQNSDDFQYIPIDSINLINANIPVYSIFEDIDRTIWIGTSGNGIIRYNKQTKKTTYSYHVDNDPYSISSNQIFKIYKDSKNNIWIGTTDNGLDRYERESGRFYNYKPIKGIDKQQNSNAVIEIFELENNLFLLGTRGDGMFFFDTDKKIFKPFQFSVGQEEAFRPSEVYSIYRDDFGHLWISTHGNGLFYFPKSFEKAIKIDHQANDPTSLINNNVRKIFEDRQGNLWVVSYQGGINILPNMHKKFKTYNLADKTTEYASNTITSVIADQNNNLWVGTDGAGLKYINRKLNTVEHFYPGSNLSRNIPDRVVMSLLLNDNELWIGTYLGGLSVYNLTNGTFKNYKSSEKTKSLGCNFISCFLKTSSGDIWVGTNGAGLNKYNRETDNFTVYSKFDSISDNRLMNNYINCLAEDNNGRIWIGTFWGISVYDPLNNFFIEYYRDESGKEGGLSNNTVYCIKITSKNEIWLGTRNGLNKFIPSKNIFKSFNLSDGLPGNVVYSIEEANNGDLWLTTNNGICRFNPKTYETHSYYESDGLASNEFFRNSTYKDHNGEIFIGSLNGLNSFQPESINENYDIPKPLITQFRIFDQEVKPGENIDGYIVLDKPIYQTNKIVLKHKFNSFAFEFAALDYILPEKNNYKCKMEGFDQDWRTVSSKLRFVTYTNLDPGTYTFKVKSSSIDNMWDDSYTGIDIIIKPPMYRTWWAYLIYYLILVGLIMLLWFFSIRRVKLKNQIKFERFERNKSEEINQAKLRFFTNVSHEFRTPITLIVGPLEKMLNDKAFSKKYKDTITMMLNNANRLLRLVNQLMDLRKMELGKMTLKTEKADIITFLRDIYNTFSDYAKQRNIDFRFLTGYNHLECWFDTDKIDKIIFNLLSNAFKFTGENGEITLLIEPEKSEDKRSFVKISVIDTGKGILPEDQPKIFERFYQSKDPSLQSKMGSGVGLSLTHSLVEQHYGKINFTSEPGRGTSFHVSIPIDEDIYRDEEKFSPAVPGVNKYIHISPEPLVKPGNFEPEGALNSDDRHLILIIEDNFDLRNYVKQELIEYYDVIEAQNGKEGLTKAMEELPDLIITDILMPEMDGLELCKRIKENFLTNHIPVIILTARASMEQRIDGIEHGADSYISKPFNPSHLKIRVKKLLELRQVLKQKYAKQLESPEPELVEEDFYLKEIKEVIIKNMDDPNLSIDKICKIIGISRAHMYRKIKLVTDKSPTEFIRLIRLNEASRLLVETEKSVSEVCYMVGFNSASYFSICFKEHFNISPIDFVKNHKKNRNGNA